MRVGEVAERAGVNVETLRYYERRGLLPAPERTPSEHRRYDEETVRFVREIKDAQAVGFTLTEIAEYVRVRRRSGAASEALRARMAEKIDQIDGRIAARRRMRDELARVVGCGCASLDHRAVAVEIARGVVAGRCPPTGSALPRRSPRGACARLAACRPKGTPPRRWSPICAGGSTGCSRTPIAVGG